LDTGTGIITWRPAEMGGGEDEVAMIHYNVALAQHRPAECE